VRVDRFERAEFSIQKLAHHLAEPGIVLREARGINGVAACLESQGQELDLRALAAAVDAFDGDQFSGGSHRLECPGETGTTVEGQSNRRDSAPQCCAC
jgi:hypothetical protein